MQRLRQLRDQIVDTRVALSSTKSAVGRLIEGYKHRMVKTEELQASVNADESEDEVIYQLLEFLREIEWLLQQADGLSQKLNGTRQLVQIAAVFIEK